MKRTRYYMPAVSSDPEGSAMSILIPRVTSLFSMGKALVARAMLRLDSGDMRGAWADLTAARRLARPIGSGYTLIEGIVAIAIEERACCACRALAGAGKLTGAQTRAFLADMQHLGLLPDLVDTIDEGERFMVLDAVMIMARKLKQKGRLNTKDWLTNNGAEDFHMMPAMTLHDKSMEWDEVLMVINPWYDRFAAARRKTFPVRDQTPCNNSLSFEQHKAKVFAFRPLLPFFAIPFNDPSAQRKINPITRRLLSQMIGHVLVSDFVPSVNRAFVLRDRAEAQGDLTLVAMVLAAYRAEKKAYPNKLSQLSPEYLKEVPDDLFIDKPFGYKRKGKGYVLYSVGENMKFDGVKKNEDEETDDIVVRVE